MPIPLGLHRYIFNPISLLIICRLATSQEVHQHPFPRQPEVPYVVSQMQSYAFLQLKCSERGELWRGSRLAVVIAESRVPNCDPARDGDEMSWDEMLSQDPACRNAVGAGGRAACG